MAVKKASLMVTFTKEEKRIINQMERFIDTDLSKNYIGDTHGLDLTFFFLTFFSDNYSEKIIQEIKRRYEKAGWIVNVERDDYKGDRIELS